MEPEREGGGNVEMEMEEQMEVVLVMAKCQGGQLELRSAAGGGDGGCQADVAPARQ